MKLKYTRWGGVLALASCSAPSADSPLQTDAPQDTMVAIQVAMLGQSDGADQVVRHRGFARKKKRQVAEQTLQLTTMPAAGN